MSKRQETGNEGNVWEDLREDEIAFIRTHQHHNPGELILKAGQFKGLDVKKLAAQIQSRQKALKKLPEWSSNEKLIFPPALSVEQCSSEATAHYKAGMVSGKTLIDITGGMGIDCYYMSRSFAETHYFEQQPGVAATAAYNFAQLGASRIHVHAGESLDALQNGLTADWLYAKQAEDQAYADRLRVEGEILRLLNLPDKGTTRLPTGLKVTSSRTRLSVTSRASRSSSSSEVGSIQWASSTTTRTGRPTASPRT